MSLALALPPLALRVPAARMNPTCTTALESGLPYPLGATPRDGGVNFAVVSEHATHLDLCLFDDAWQHEARCWRCRPAPATSGTASCPAPRPA
ncbi:MAG: hypothetical protein U5L03_12210 [Burkholderiaceae bacterium]|nr:hypothetical protein [Burkholderiaceae bacterium]